MSSKIVSFDFDGLVAAYDRWQGIGIFGDLIPGTVEAFEELEAEGWQIIIFTARPEIQLVRKYLIENAVPFLYVTNRKPSAHIYVDDRAIQFNGDWDDTLRQIRSFEPWYRRAKKTPAHRLEPYCYAGKIGPWARGGAEGVRFLATGPPQSPKYLRILSAKAENGSWRYLEVHVEGEDRPRSVWCGNNVYKEA